jgi:hypothetical protein
MRRMKMKCNKCNASARFQHEGVNWCATDSFIGTANMFGYCKTKKVNSKQLRRKLNAIQK